MEVYNRTVFVTSCRDFNTARKNLKRINDFLRGELMVSTNYIETIYKDYIMIQDNDDKQDYEKALLEGQRFFVREKLSNLIWLDKMGNECYCGLVKVANAYLDDERKQNIKNYESWGIKTYLNDLSFKLQTNVHHQIDETTKSMVIMPQSVEHNEVKNKTIEFIDERGTGEFQKTEILDMTGMPIESSKVKRLA